MGRLSRGVSCTAVASLAVSGLLLAAGPAAASSHGWRITQTSTLPGTLQAVACAARSGCEVVGYPAFGPQPKYGWMDAVTCGRFGCVTVGGSIYGFRAARLTSTGWKMMPLKGPPSLYGESLKGVACTSRASCLAVGNADTNTRVDCPVPSPAGPNCLTSLPILEQWNGSEWAIGPRLPAPVTAVIAVPVPSGQPFSLFNDVACAPTRPCVVIGEVFDATSPTEAFADMWNGTSWTLATIPTPPGVTAAQLTSVSCGRSRCLAVGAATLDGKAVPIAAEEVGGQWSDVDPEVRPPAKLGSVSCAPSGACVAVGYQGNGNGRRPLIERLASGRWTHESTPVPPGSRSRGGSSLASVSCVTATSCEAVGNYQRTTNQGLNVGWFVEATGAPVP